MGFRVMNKSAGKTQCIHVATQYHMRDFVTSRYAVLIVHKSHLESQMSHQAEDSFTIITDYGMIYEPMSCD